MKPNKLSIKDRLKISSTDECVKILKGGKPMAKNMRLSFLAASFDNDSTSLEMAFRKNGDTSHWRYIFARRLPDLREAGLVETQRMKVCKRSTTSRPCIAWGLTVKGVRVFTAMRDNFKSTVNKNQNREVKA